MTQERDYLDFLEYGRMLADNTLKSIAHDFEMFKSILGVDLETANRRDVEKFVIEQNKEKLSTATVARRIASVKGFFQWQIENEYREGLNPAQGKIAPKVKHDSFKSIGIETLKEVYHQAPTKELKTMIALMGYGGLRLEEVATVSIDNFVYRDDNGVLAIDLKNTKGDRPRKVSLALVPDQELVERVCNRGFIGQRGKLSTNGVWRRVRDYLSSKGLKKVSPHDLRATFATMLANNDVNHVVIRDMMGHTTLNGNAITSIYVTTTSVEDQAQEVLEKMEGVL